MKTGSMINRVADEINQWRSREERFEKLFSAGALKNKSFLKEKLQYQERLLAKYGNTSNEEERMTLGMLRQEKNGIEKQVYPNILIRLLRRLYLPFKQQSLDQKEAIQHTINEQQLKAALSQAGFGGMENRLTEQLKQGKAEFTIPVSYYVNDKEHLDYYLNFTKKQDGNYSFDNYKAELRSRFKPEDNRQQVFAFTGEQAFNAKQAFNLLSGRPLERECLGLDGNGQKVWQQLDFNDKDADGNYRLRAFQMVNEFNLKQYLETLPLKESGDPVLINGLIRSLANGDKPEAILIKNNKEEKVLLEANPLGRAISLYDLQNKKLSLVDAESKPAGTKVIKMDQSDAKYETKQVRKRGVSVRS